MKRAIAVFPAGQDTHLRPIDTLLLDFDQRQRPEGVCRGLRGTQIEMALSHSVRLRTDDRLILDDDTLVEIVARPEPLFELRAATAPDLARIAWMLGDRHVPVEILERRLRVKREPLVAALFENTGIRIAAIEAPFEPEGGAYDHVLTGSAAHDNCTHDGHNHDH